MTTQPDTRPCFHCGAVRTTGDTCGRCGCRYGHVAPLGATDTMAAVRDKAGQLPAYAWPGGYPLTYLAADGGTFCPPCANGENGSEARTDPATASSDWLVIGWAIHWEGPAETCDHCGAQIESAYGNPDDDDDDD